MSNINRCKDSGHEHPIPVLRDLDDREVIIIIRCKDSGHCHSIPVLRDLDDREVTIIIRCEDSSHIKCSMQRTRIDVITQTSRLYLQDVTAHDDLIETIQLSFPYSPKS